jgi:hypothetical protein
VDTVRAVGDLPVARPGYEELVLGAGRREHLEAQALDLLWAGKQVIRRKGDLRISVL